jgi:hypothetical protein
MLRSKSLKILAIIGKAPGFATTQNKPFFPMA